MSLEVLKPLSNIHFNPVLLSKEGIFSSPQLGHLLPFLCSAHSLSQLMSSCSLTVSWAGAVLHSGFAWPCTCNARKLSLHPFHTSLGEHLASLC